MQCCFMCVGGDDDLLLLATEVGVVQTSVSGSSAQVIAPMASDESNGEDAILQSVEIPCHFHLLAHTSCTFYVCYVN